MLESGSLRRPGPRRGYLGNNTVARHGWEVKLERYCDHSSKAFTTRLGKALAEIDPKAIRPGPTLPDHRSRTPH